MADAMDGPVDPHKYDGSAPMLCAVTADLEVFVGNCRRDTGHGESCPEERQDHRAAHGDRHARSAISRTRISAHS
jgi:hypothetical protein